MAYPLSSKRTPHSAAIGTALELDRREVAGRLANVRGGPRSVKRTAGFAVSDTTVLVGVVGDWGKEMLVGLSTREEVVEPGLLEIEYLCMLTMGRVFAASTISR